MSHTSIKHSAVDVSTSEFERAHAKSPKGVGYWGFCPYDKYCAADYLSHVYWVSGGYGVAKRDAQQHFAALGVDSIVVCS